MTPPGWLRRILTALSFLVLGPLFLLGLLVFAAVAPFTALPAMRRRRAAARAFRDVHAHAGRVVLLAYTSSPHWQEYIESVVLPRIAPHAVALNRSERSDWRAAMPVEAALLDAFAGDRSYNPIAIVVPPRSRPEVIRFFEAFRDHKHGRPQALDEAVARLYRRVDELVR